MEDTIDKKAAVSVSPPIELLPCPFCGRNNPFFARRTVGWLHNEGTTERTVVVCGDCGAQGSAFSYSSYDNEKSAAQKWNRRRNQEAKEVLAVEKKGKSINEFGKEVFESAVVE